MSDRRQIVGCTSEVDPDLFAQVLRTLGRTFGLENVVGLDLGGGLDRSVVAELTDLDFVGDANGPAPASLGPKYCVILTEDVTAVRAGRFDSVRFGLDLLAALRPWVQDAVRISIILISPNFENSLFLNGIQRRIRSQPCR
jgi:hypothetical protein